MKKDNFIWWALGGIGALALYYHYQNNKTKSVSTQDLVVDVIKEEQNKYSTPFQVDYNIIMPSDLIRKRVREKGEQLRAGRFAIQPDKVQAPLYL